MSRLDKTLADYVAIAISPALIMLMVGSLMWFLVAVFYQGYYDGRIYWILACFVVAIVLVARIAIEESRERAMLFALPLACAVGLATMRFSDSVFFHWILLGLAWWSSHKLTWDCTLIDEEQDSSGQGLLQLAGFRKRKAEPEDAQGPADAQPGDQTGEPEGVTERVGRMREEAHPRRRTAGKAHAPGVWIVYFSLAALPLFGLGQVLVPAGDSARRLWTFQLLCVYVAAGLSLLVTTSFLGLRRYLRQRGVQMPAEMAGVWIALGAGIIVVLLAAAAILPRPAAEYSIAQVPDFPLKFSTPERRSNRHAAGSEGADENDPDSQSLTQGEQDGTKPEGGASQEAQRREQGSQTPEDQDGDGEQSGGEQSGGQQSGGQQSGSQQSGGEQSGGEQSADSSRRSEQQASERSDSSRREEDSTGPDRGNDRQADQSPEDSPPDEREDRAGDRPADSRNSKPQDRGGSSQRQSDRQAVTDPQEETDPQDDGSGPSDRAESTGEPWFQAPQIELSGGIAGLLKYLLYAALACAGVYWIWRNWARLVEGLRQILKELQNLWAALFGRRRKGQSLPADEERPKSAHFRAFSAYVDPFAAGTSGRYTPDALVRYTFEAAEAWARENGCPREPDQTPHEFALQVSGQAAGLKAGAKVLADLYCQLAYSPGSLSPKQLQPLAQFWERMRASQRAEPPPVQSSAG